MQNLKPNSEKVVMGPEHEQVDEDEVEDEDDHEKNTNNNFSINSDDNDESYDIPPERDLRDTQPTISVNYRVIKDKGERDLINEKKKKKNTQYEDDWENNNFEW